MNVILQVSLPESTPAGKSVITVNATDADEGENARITYSMLPVTGFTINPANGMVT